MSHSHTHTGHWNKDTGALWVADSATGATKALGTTTRKLDTYDLLGRNGFVRHDNWMLVPGMRRHRTCQLTKATS